ncbi:hypothetical protein KSC_076900 [Ktedonobacter sp. SOSP1-52]|uniref:hypothetical protein n=1 Tax=Ktedonobacter sp. SOSP1-52 TaxID=2778366 RepID=UPI001915AD2C|nr:hypothetical protein [Ktedonobacter sp. SOSP1-52]GHO68798.1 hypothetical protein KSC_076900 [Ktedonobacter sp. SOSP1-52]
MRWFEVALWRRWPSLFPDCTARVWAWDAFSAVEYTMRRYRLALVDYASVYAEDHALIYRAHKIAVPLEEEPLLTAAEETVCVDGFVVGNVARLVRQNERTEEVEWVSDS